MGAGGGLKIALTSMEFPQLQSAFEMNNNSQKLVLPTAEGAIFWPIDHRKTTEAHTRQVTSSSETQFKHLAGHMFS